MVTGNSSFFTSNCFKIIIAVDASDTKSLANLKNSNQKNLCPKIPIDSEA